MHKSCYMMACGKDASSDGSVLVARSPDALGDYAMQIKKVPRKEYDDGDVLLISKSKGVSIPQVKETYSYLGIMGILEGEIFSIAEGGINEHQVTAGASTGGYLNPKALEVCKNIPTSIGDYRMTLILERCKTAKEGVRLLGELTERYGARTDNYLVADPSEAWIYEEYKDFLWAAARIPDNCYFVEANTVRIGEIELDDPKNYLGSENLEEFAIKNNLYNPEQDGSFNLAKVYGAQTGKVRHGISAPEYDRRRIWRGISLLSPSIGLKPEASWDPEYFPLFVEPDEKITPKDFLAIFTDHYQGTKFDKYGANQHNYIISKNAMRTGRGGDREISSFQINDEREYQLAPIWGKERIIGTPRAVTTWCAQLRSWMPNPIGGILWAGLSEGATSGRLPWYCGIKKTPKPYNVGISIESQISRAPYQGSTYDENSAYWIFRVVSNLVNLFYSATKDEVIPVWRKWEENLFETQPTVDKLALELYEKNPDLGIEFITNYSNAKAIEALEMAKEMTKKLHTIIAHYNAPL